MGVKMTRELVQAARSGNKRAYDRFGVWLADEVLGFHLKQGRAAADMGELCQVTALRIIEDLQQAPDDPNELRGWVLGYAGMVGKEHITRGQRQKLRNRAAARTALMTPARRPDSLLDVRRLLAFVRSKFNALPSHYRRTFGPIVKGDDRKDVAKDLDVAEGTVRRRMWWVRRQLESTRDRSRRTRPRYRT